MLYAFLVCLAFALTGVALYFFFRSQELSSQLRKASETWQQEAEAYTSELARLDKIRHIPDIIDRARKSKADVEARLAEAGRKAEEIVQRAVAEAQERGRKLRTAGEKELEVSRETGCQILIEASARKREAEEALRLAKAQSQAALDEAHKAARDLASKARKDAKEKREKAEATLDLATSDALNIRRKAEHRAEQIAGAAYEAKGKLKEYEGRIQALQNRIDKYEGVYLVPPTHILDELAEEFGFNKAGERLKLARERTRIMQANGTAAICGYPEGWKRDHALKFVLSTFNGKVDTILSRIKPGNQGKLIQEIKDAYALVNKDGDVYKNARILEEYLDSRLEEVKWAVAVQKLKEKAREEQRAIKEQIREEERAKKEIERAIKQAAREEELVNKAIDRVRKQLEEASEAEKSMFTAQLSELRVRLVEAEEKGKKAISMARQTKKGYVYVISNIGSFGENVYKIGLTRRLDPTERVRELGDASVPFPFDVHAMISSEDAPGLENALHKRFVERQVNKTNKRKEFFRVSLQELKNVVDELRLDTAWTIEAEASQYRESLALELAMKSDAALHRKWLEEQASFDFEDESLEDVEQELEEVEA
ncbi:GIY-YIG nuclease family protein [Planctomyces sp. SH-PL62]|uniref:GIY-YIG nuclease family protein n=1 Tax=Planctomyces sp. SH-PL62 TaxID=1636152 RepID=UPI00078E1DEE|nr:GIY-YIG nuclease family protein [Planctomyces sp. SH-PL62]AMV40845.1 T5orf172 domain protein [Planctomyces sp. SH-PL62]